MTGFRSTICARRYVLTFLLALTTLALFGQPLLSSRQQVAGVEVFRDLVRDKQYYYLPGKLELGRDEDSRPWFQLLQMRYTGTGLVGDQGSQRFINLVQIGVRRKPVDYATLRTIKEEIGPDVDLVPLPLVGLDAHLVLPLGESDGRYRRIGGAASAGEMSSENGQEWTQQYFTIRLEAHDAELLWSQISEGRRVFSITYAYYANVVAGERGSYALEGDSVSVAGLEHILDEFTALDSTASPRAVLSGSVPVDLDVGRWPDLLRRIDLNEGAPPAWAYLELRCYDFANALRPDLAMKSVEVEATGVTGQPVRPKAIRFMAARPEEHTHQVRFPYAVDVRKPYRYRVTEYTAEGEPIPGQWLVEKEWAGLLDVTTPSAVLPYEEHAVEVEVDTAAFLAAGYEELSLLIIYQRGGEARREVLNWPLATSDISPWRLSRFFADKGELIYYHTVTQRNGERSRVGPRPIGPDHYLFLQPNSEMAEGD